MVMALLGRIHHVIPMHCKKWGFAPLHRCLTANHLLNSIGMENGVRNMGPVLSFLVELAHEPGRRGIR
jgi:hypothetical protein